MKLDRDEIEELLKGLNHEIREHYRIMKDELYRLDEATQLNQLLIEAHSKRLKFYSDLYSKLFNRMMELTD